MNEMFPILAIETSDDLCSAAVMIDENKFAEQNIKAKHVHSEKLVTMIDSVVKSVDLQISDINTIAVSEGPGSFTGLRIGMAAAKGLASGSDLSIAAIPTFDALAFKIASYIHFGVEFLIIKKANRDEIYFSKYVKEKDAVKNLVRTSLLFKDEVDKYLAEDVLVFSNIDEISSNKDLTTPNAIDVARWTYKFGKDLVTSDYDLIQPKYLKKFVVKERKK